MKKILFILFLILLTSLFFAEDFSLYIKNIEDKKITLTLKTNYLPVDQPRVLLFTGFFNSIHLIKKTMTTYEILIDLDKYAYTDFSFYVEGEDINGETKKLFIKNMFSKSDFLPKIDVSVLTVDTEEGIEIYIDGENDDGFDIKKIVFGKENFENTELLKNKLKEISQGQYVLSFYYKNKFQYEIKKDVKIIKINDYVFSESVLRPKQNNIISGLHIIKKGESLYKIASDYGISAGDLVNINKLEDPSKIYAGQPLVIGKVDYQMSPLLIKIEVSKNTLSLYYGQTLLKKYIVAVGRSDSTPPGYYKIMYKEKEPALYWYGEYINPGSIINGIGSRWLQLSDPQYGIHGTTKPWEIGKRISHGCIRMFNFNVEELDFLAALGTEVYVEKEDTKEIPMDPEQIKVEIENNEENDKNLKVE